MLSTRLTKGHLTPKLRFCGGIKGFLWNCHGNARRQAPQQKQHSNASRLEKLGIKTQDSIKVGFEQQEQGGLGVLEGSLVGDRSQSMTECLYSIIQIKLPENVFLVT